MALLICTGCTASYAVGAKKCPQCGSTDHILQGEDQSMSPKITRHGGPTVAGARVVGGAWGDSDDIEWVGEHGPETVAFQPDTSEEGGEESSPGSSSSASPAKPSTSSKKSAPGRRKPARTTGSPSGQDPTDSSTAPLTGGGQTAGSSDTSDGSA